MEEFCGGITRNGEGASISSQSFIKYVLIRDAQCRQSELGKINAYQIVKATNRPFSYSKQECGLNDMSLPLVEFSNIHNTDRSFNATQSNLVYRNIVRSKLFC